MSACFITDVFVVLLKTSRFELLILAHKGSALT